MKYIKILLLALLTVSCSEKKLEPITNSLGKPEVVTDIKLTPISGGVDISYKIPKTEDILAVKCIYSLHSNNNREVSTSYFNDKLQVKGFDNTDTHSATLYTVNRAQVLSDPIEISFTPLESALSKTKKTVSIIPDFGGARFNWKNVDKEPLNVEFFGPDSSGRINTLKILSTNIVDNSFSIRGYEPKTTTFSMVISDNYNNYSDTISGEVLPMFEEKINKAKMSIMKLNNDASFTNWEGMDGYLIDDDTSTMGHTANNSLPAAVTIDLGTETKLSRFLVHQREFSNTFYNHGNPKKMTVYTCYSKPNPSGDWNEWVKVMDCEIVKPSGSLGNIVTDLDMETAKVGHEFTFDLSSPPTRYIRIVFLSTWGGATFTHPTELDFYGDIQNK